MKFNMLANNYHKIPVQSYHAGTVRQNSDPVGSSVMQIHSTHEEVYIQLRTTGNHNNDKIMRVVPNRQHHKATEEDDNCRDTWRRNLKAEMEDKRVQMQLEKDAGGRSLDGEKLSVTRLTHSDKVN